MSRLWYKDIQQYKIMTYVFIFLKIRHAMESLRFTLQIVFLLKIFINSYMALHIYTHTCTHAYVFPQKTIWKENTWASKVTNSCVISDAWFLKNFFLTFVLCSYITCVWKGNKASTRRECAPSSESWGSKLERKRKLSSFEDITVHLRKPKQINI